MHKCVIHDLGVSVFPFVWIDKSRSSSQVDSCRFRVVIFLYSSRRKVALKTLLPNVKLEREMMAPGPSTGWKLVWRALKAGRHKAARTLKVAGK